MARAPLALLFVVSVLGTLLSTSVARADPRTAFLVEQLTTSDDYRVRTQAALALGASGDDAAVKPLCTALGDGNAAVKVASAAALGKLGKPAGLPCLQAAAKTESVASAKAQIEKSIGALQGGGASAAPPPPGPDTKYYVALQITNKTSRQPAEIEGIVRAALQSKIISKPGFAVAPKSETPAQGGQLVKSNKLKGFFLIATVEAPVYAGGNLVQSVKVSMWTYPDKVLQGEFSPKLTQSNTPSTDVQSENELMKLCIENAVATFHKIVASL